MIQKDNTLGLVHIYEGNGKGKTTAALGLAIRMCGTGRRVWFGQFLKGRDTSELSSLQRLDIEVERTTPVVKFIRNMTAQEYEECVESCRNLFKKANEAAKSGRYGLVVLDEILDVIIHEIISTQELCDLLQEKHPTTEIALTGRHANDTICNKADYISQIEAIKHPYNAGITARRGVEY